MRTLTVAFAFAALLAFSAAADKPGAFQFVPVAAHLGSDTPEWQLTGAFPPGVPVLIVASESGTATPGRTGDPGTDPEHGTPVTIVDLDRPLAPDTAATIGIVADVDYRPVNMAPAAAALADRDVEAREALPELVAVLESDPAIVPEEAYEVRAPLAPPVAVIAYAVPTGGEEEAAAYAVIAGDTARLVNVECGPEPAFMSVDGELFMLTQQVDCDLARTSTMIHRVDEAGFIEVFSEDGFAR